MNLDESRPMPKGLYEEKQPEKWDVQSVLSTYTNTDNHPGIIGVVKPGEDKLRMPKIKITTKATAAPGGYKEAEAIDEGEDEDEEIEEEEDEVDLDAMSPKSRKKYLKKQFKAEKRERRKMKKQMK